MKIFLYDGSFPGLLTAFFDTYRLKEPFKVYQEAHYMPNLFDQVYTISTDEVKFQRVYESIFHKLSKSILKTVYFVYLSEMPESSTLICTFLKLCYGYGASITLAKNNDIIIQIDTLYRKVSLEGHRFKGLIRFKEIGPLTFYSSIEPDHHILPIITNHFITRFNDQRFMIHDIKREVALIYDLNDYFLKDVSYEFYQNLKNTLATDHYEKLFKTFYQHVTIPERLNLRQMKSYMPKRYWKHLIEL